MKRKLDIKKAFLVCIILANVVFICVKSDTFKSEMSRIINRQTEEQLIEKSEETIVLDANTVVEQEFIPVENKLGKFKVYFINDKPHENKGEICFSVLDAEKNVLYSDSLDASSVKHDSATIFDLSGNTKIINSSYIVNRKTYNASKGIRVEAGETYILQIKAVDVEGTMPLEVILTDNNPNIEKKLTVDGKIKDGDCIYSSAIYYRFTYKT